MMVLLVLLLVLLVLLRLWYWEVLEMSRAARVDLTSLITGCQVVLGHDLELRLQVLLLL